MPKTGFTPYTSIGTKRLVLNMSGAAGTGKNNLSMATISVKRFLLGIENKIYKAI